MPETQTLLVDNVEIELHEDGTVESPWWTPEIAELICSFCGKGEGYSVLGALKPEELLGKKKQPVLWV